MTFHEEADGRKRGLVVARVCHVRVRLVEGQKEHVVGVRQSIQRHPVHHGGEATFVARGVRMRGPVLGVGLEAFEVLFLPARLRPRPGARRREVLERAA